MLLIFYLLIQNDDVYMAAKLPHKQLAKSIEVTLNLCVAGTRTVYTLLNADSKCTF